MKRILFAILIVLMWVIPVNAMICLDNTDTLEGGASVDAVIDFTVHGLVGSTFTNIAQGQLSDTDPTVLYTAGAAISIVSVIYVNTHSAAVTVNLYLDPANAATPRRMIPKDLSLGIGYSMHFDGQRCTVMDDNGGIVSGLNISNSADLAALLDDETGTGVAVFSTTPTLVTPNIGAATGTSIDVGASTLATRSLTVDTGGVFNIDLGGAAGDDFTIEGTQFVVESDTGFVGIGTATPGGVLPSSFVAGKILEIKSSTTGKDSGILLRRSDSLIGLDIWQDSDTGHAYFDNIFNNDDGVIIFRTKTLGTPINALTIIGTGEVGIGVTPSGTYTLEVGGTGHFTGALTALSYTDNTPFYEGDAIAAIKGITGVDGEIDHASLPVFVQHNILVTTKTVQKGIKIPVAEKDAFEDKNIIKTVNVKVDDKPVISKTVTTYSTVDGKVVATETPEYQTEEVVTGTRKALKAGVKLDDKTGELYTQTETEVETVVVEPGRDLGAMISILTVAVQQMAARVETLEKSIVVVPK